MRFGYYNLENDDFNKQYGRFKKKNYLRFRSLIS